MEIIGKFHKIQKDPLLERKYYKVKYQIKTSHAGKEFRQRDNLKSYIGKTL